MELSDKAFGVSNPRYIKRQAQILKKAKSDLDEIELFLGSQTNSDDTPYKVAMRKFEYLKARYSKIFKK